jgi:hypothetical protein
MSVAIAPSDVRWVLVPDLFDPPGQRVAPALNRRRRWSTRCCSSGGRGSSGATCRARHPPWTAVDPKGGACERTGCRRPPWPAWRRSSADSTILSSRPASRWSTSRPLRGGSAQMALRTVRMHSGVGPRGLRVGDCNRQLSFISIRTLSLNARLSHPTCAGTMRCDRELRQSTPV